MRKQALAKSFSFLWLTMLLLGSPTLHGACGGPTVLWHNLSDIGCAAGQTSAGITTNVVDQNIDVQGINALVGPIHVQALTCDIVITITSGDVTLTGSGNRCDGVPVAGQPRLYLEAAVGRTITLDLTSDLIFSGTADQGLPVDLLVSAVGDGIITFSLANNTTVRVEATSVDNGGATFAVVSRAGQTPSLFFVRQNTNTLLPVNINVGARSRFIFASSNTVPGSASLTIDPTNQGNGLTTLTINGGAFELGVRALTSVSPDFLLSDIDFIGAPPLGSVATLNIVNSNLLPGAPNVLRIINDTVGCPTYQFDPFCQGTALPFAAGFVLAPNGVLIIADSTYLDYIGTATNTCCTFTLLDECGVTTTYERLRNASAFIVDGLADNSSTSTIQFLGSGAIYFRSGVDSCGVVNDNGLYTIDPTLRTLCAGNIVFDVEGRLDVIGTVGFNSGLNVLSLEVDPVGCPILPGGTEAPVFPARTYARNLDGSYVSYNNAAFLINNRMNLFNTHLIHTDENHNVYQKATLGQGLVSEPTYIGGDTYWLCAQAGSPKPGLEHPLMAFYNSTLDVETDMAATGVDFRIPNYLAGPNNSNFTFYSNGFCVDHGYGRNLILGTTPCFDDGCYTSTDNSAQLDVIQEGPQPAPTAQILHLLTAYNNACVTEDLIQSITGQYSLHSIFLNNGTNLSIGTPSLVGTDTAGNSFVLTTTPSVLIEGSCFSFDSLGGRAFAPELSSSTGQGGIFVDQQGRFSLEGNRIANFGAMVTRSGNAIINLPENAAVFAPHLGIAQWFIDLTQPSQRVIIPATTSLADYTFDWGSVTKDYCCSNTQTTGCFIPYNAGDALITGSCPPVTALNLTNLPVVRGVVQQFQVQRSRICDMMHLLVDGGYIRELVFLSGNDVGDAATAFLVLDNEGTVGLSSAKKGIDSLVTEIVLGVNGVILAPNGDGTIVFNDDIIINNVCPIVTGTGFGVAGENRLRLTSVLPHKLTIKSTGILDLTQFTNANQVLEIGGELTLVAEPGARIVLGGGILNFNQNAQFSIQPVNDPLLLAGGVPADLDEVRVRMSGTGNVVFADDAMMLVPQNALFGIESYADVVNSTSLFFELQDQSSIQIGSPEWAGGAFQVGDTGTITTTATPRSVSFSLTLDGEGALFQLDRNGFFGLAAGVADKSSDIPNTWAITCLSNVSTVTVNIVEGTFSSDQIVTGNSALASVLAIGTGGTYTFNFDYINSAILGGGNLIKVNCTQLCAGGICSVVPTSVVPTVTGFAGTQPGGFITSGILAGKKLLQDARKPQQPVSGLRAAGLFNYLSTPNAASNATMASPRANITRERVTQATLGYIVGSAIIRNDIINLITNVGGTITSPDRSLNIGAVDIVLDTNSGSLIRAQELNGAGAF